MIRMNKYLFSGGIIGGTDISWTDQETQKLLSGGMVGGVSLTDQETQNLLREVVYWNSIPYAFLVGTPKAILNTLKCICSTILYLLI